MKTFNIEELWIIMKKTALKEGMKIGGSNGKEIIIDTIGKQIFIKLRAGDLKSEIIL